MSNLVKTPLESVTFKTDVVPSSVNSTDDQMWSPLAPKMRPQEKSQDATSTPPLIFKIITVGSSGVGKSCLIHRYSKGFYPDVDATTTVSPEYIINHISVQDVRMQFRILDSVGQERFRSMARPYYRGCHCAIIAYDIGNKDTFIDLSMWLVEVDACCDPIVKVLVGNKLDKERQVTREEGETFARQHGFDFFIETSAKTGASVENLFFDIAEQLMLKYKDGQIEAEVLPDVIRLGSVSNYTKNRCSC